MGAPVECLEHARRLRVPFPLNTAFYCHAVIGGSSRLRTFESWTVSWPTHRWASQVPCVSFAARPTRTRVPTKRYTRSGIGLTYRIIHSSSCCAASHKTGLFHRGSIPPRAQSRAPSPRTQRAAIVTHKQNLGGLLCGSASSPIHVNFDSRPSVPLECVHLSAKDGLLTEDGRINHNLSDP